MNIFSPTLKDRSLKNPQELIFREKSRKKVLAGMSHAPKGAIVPKKRGLLGFFYSKGRKRGSKIVPITRFTGCGEVLFSAFGTFF
jgi:hypothetical protein